MTELNNLLENIKNIQVNIGNAIINKGQSVTNFASYPEAIENIQSGGDVPVKLFKTKEEMNSSTGNVEGDLALVYKNEIQPITEESEFDSCTFPQTVVLKEAFTDDIYGRFRAVDSSSGMFDGDVDMSSSNFRFDGFGDTMVRVQYTSSDGITYTRTDGGEELQEFGTVIKYEPMGPWNDNFGYFMQIGTSVFEGIYIYKNNSWQLAPTQLTATPGDVYKQLFYGENGIESGILGTPDNSFADANAEIYNQIQNQYENMEPRILTDDNKTIDKNIYVIPVKKDGTPLLDTSNVTNMNYMFSDCHNLTTIPGLNASKVTGMAGMFNNCTNLTIVPELDTSKVTGMSEMFGNCTNLTTISELNTSNVTDMGGMFKGCKSLTSIPELDTSKVMFMNLMFQFCSNLITIPLLNTSNVTNMGNMFQECTNLASIPQLDTSKVTDMSMMFSDCISLTTIPLLDTSNVTNMQNMFNECKSLTVIPLLNTSKVTDMFQMFRGCKSLTSIPELDTSNVTSMVSMFYDCTNLTSIPELDTSKVTDMHYMFYGCTNLTAVPQLDTSEVTDMNYMFYGCSNLTTIPQLNTSNTMEMDHMFSNCEKLSDDSLNNILAMCTNAGRLTNGTLKYIGLTEDQANKCTTLSNYSAFTSAGWTTGY